MRHIFILTLLFAKIYALSVTSGLTQEYTATPGERIEGSISLSNSNNGPARVRTNHNDYLFNHEGRNSFPEAGSQERSNAKWITWHSPQTFDIGPKSVSKLKFTVDIPKDPKLCGTYWSILFVEEEGITPTAPKDRHVAVTTKVRYGVQVITHIDESGEADLKIISQEITEKEGEKLLKIGVENVGTRSTRPEGALTLFDKKGTKLKQITGNRANIFPGCSHSFYFDLEEVQKGEYQSLIVFEGKSDDIFGVMKDLTVE